MITYAWQLAGQKRTWFPLQSAWTINMYIWLYINKCSYNVDGGWLSIAFTNLWPCQNVIKIAFPYRGLYFGFNGLGKTWDTQIILENFFIKFLTLSRWGLYYSKLMEILKAPIWNPSMLGYFYLGVVTLLIHASIFKSSNSRLNLVMWGCKTWPYALI